MRSRQNPKRCESKLAKRGKNRRSALLITVCRGLHGSSTGRRQETPPKKERKVFEGNPLCLGTNEWNDYSLCAIPQNSVLAPGILPGNLSTAWTDTVQNQVLKVLQGFSKKIRIIQRLTRHGLDLRPKVCVMLRDSPK